MFTLSKLPCSPRVDEHIPNESSSNVIPGVPVVVQRSSNRRWASKSAANAGVLVDAKSANPIPREAKREVNHEANREANEVFCVKIKTFWVSKPQVPQVPEIARLLVKKIRSF